MKKNFGKNVIPSLKVETNLDMQILISKTEELKSMGYVYDGYINAFIIQDLQKHIFLEKNIKNVIGDYSVTLKEEKNSGFYPKHSIPLLIDEKFYWNNMNFQEYNFFYIRGGDINGFNNQGKEGQYLLSYSDDLLSILLSNNFAGIQTEYDFGSLKAGIQTHCNFSVQYNKYVRNVIILSISTIFIEDSL